MTKLSIASLLLAAAALPSMADTGGGGGGPNDADMFFIVHAQDQEGTITIDANGRIKTELNERPEWAHGLAVALLGERTTYYNMRLGEEGAKAHLEANTMYVEDLCWVAFDEAGDEVEVQPLAEFRVHQLAMLLGVDGEGEINGAIAERYIGGDTTDWTEEQAHQDENAMTNGQRSAQG